MHLQKLNPTTPGRALVGSEFLSRAGECSDLTTLPILINRLQQRLAISAPHAATIVRLAGLGPKEAR